MSAPRPWPVTATIGKRRPPGSFRPHLTESLSSDGSTESLLSGVDDVSSHTSDQGDGLQELHLKHQQSHPAMQDYCLTDNSKNVADERSRTAICESKKPLKIVKHSGNTHGGRVLSEKHAEEDHDAVNQFGAWEKWMLQKAEEELKRREAQAHERKRQKEAKLLEETERQSKFAKADKIRRDWIRMKNAEAEKQEKKQRTQEMLTKREAELKKKDIEERAEKRYREWLDAKVKAEALKKELEVECQRLKELELQEKKQRSHEAFQQWLKSLADRPRWTPHSYARCDGGVTGYYDSGASRSPTFCNPIPWQPVCAPPPRTTNTKKKSRKKTIKTAWSLDD